MALIPAGEFQMGDERVEHASPVQKITVSAFAIDKLEVSVDLWKEVADWGKKHGYDLNANQGFVGQYPVLASWYDVAKWNNARSEKEGRTPSYYEDSSMMRIYRDGIKNNLSVNWKSGYRLPTDAEWERAARGGIEGKLYPWGTDDINPDLANYYKSDKGGPVPVGMYPPNPYGLYDMAGNVFEWCWDWYGSTTIPGEVDPKGPIDGSRRVLRGGGWSFDSVQGRLARREAYEPSAGFGFRSVLSPGQP
jgi:formylglycine-generating enzyme required for sulfatase activity